MGASGWVADDQGVVEHDAVLVVHDLGLVTDSTGLPRRTVRYDVRYRGPDGKEHCKTLHAKKEAERYEREQRTALDKGAWIDARNASERFGEYADRWLAERHQLRPRTVELYESLLKLHIKPRFGGLPLGKVASSSALVRSWNSELPRVPNDGCEGVPAVS
jgi:hypothetical protein